MERDLFSLFLLNHLQRPRGAGGEPNTLLPAREKTGISILCVREVSERGLADGDYAGEVTIPKRNWR